MMRPIIIVFCAALSSCAITSGNMRGPNGAPVHFIDGMSASVAYAKANQLCPSGYRILGEPRQTSVVDYEMTVECKSPDDGIHMPVPENPATQHPIRYRCTDLEGHPYVTNTPVPGCVVE